MFEMFSAAHMAALAAAAIVFAAIVIGRKGLRGEKAGRRFRIVMAVLLAVCEISLQLSYFIEDSWSVGSLPFQLCSLTLLISAATLAFRVKQLYAIVFFLGTLGAMQAMVTPNLDQPFPHFRYFHFFIAHIGIIATAVYLITVERYRPTIRSVFAALLWLHALAVPAAIVNIVTGTTNFMFLARKPETASLLDMLAPWPWYLIQLEAIALGLCMLLLGVSKLAFWINRRIKG